MKRLLCCAWLALLAMPGRADVPAEVTLAVGQSVLLSADVRRAALGSGRIVSVATPQRGQLLLFGEAPGETTAQLWLGDGRQRALTVRVTLPDLSGRREQVAALLADTPAVTAHIRGAHIVLEGQRASAVEMARASEVAALFPGDVLNFVGQSGWEPMVELQVRLVEVRRDQVRRLGLRWDSSTAGPQLAVAAGAGSGGGTAHLSWATTLNATLDLLQQKGLAYTLAEPVLLCRSGGAARFISGGEVPLPVTDGLGTPSIQYKEYGLIVDARPRASRDGGITADIDVELSQVDAAVRAGDFPGFSKRRASAAFNVQTGQTVALAGLVSREQSRDRAAVPGLGGVPALGALFRSSRRQSRETELLVLITPRIVEAGVPADAVARQPELVDRARQMAIEAEAGRPADGPKP